MGSVQVGGNVTIRAPLSLHVESETAVLPSKQYWQAQWAPYHPSADRLKETRQARTDGALVVNNNQGTPAIKQECYNSFASPAAECPPGERGGPLWGVRSRPTIY